MLATLYKTIFYFSLVIGIMISLSMVKGQDKVAGNAISFYGKNSDARFRGLVLAENGGHHFQYSKVARTWLDRLAADSNFLLDYIHSTDSIDEEYLKKYKLFIQLDYPPYAWNAKAVNAFEKYITEGRGGWIGFHHATLLGEFDGYPMWQWFSGFMGGIKFKDYIADFAAGNVRAEDVSHPVMEGIPSSFLIKKEEWYIYDKSPRSNVHVIANVDESSYSPVTGKTMGDHPVSRLLIPRG